MSKHVANTLTLDNGLEFANHANISKITHCNIYFAEPYKSWQRGLNENTNGLIRQYFPKGTNFRDVENYTIKDVENKLNDRPRKSLNYSTPNEVLASNCRS